jgi:ElaB/YqjD/DUF883 family membrane-anchored ribosome-binding protein
MSNASTPSDAAGDATGRDDSRPGRHPDEAPADQSPRSLQQRYREAEQSYEDVRDQLETYNRRTVDFIRDNPAVCIAGALGAGYLLGRLASKRWLT